MAGTSHSFGFSLSTSEGTNAFNADEDHDRTTTIPTSNSIPRILPPPPPPQRHPRRPVPPIHVEQALSLTVRRLHDLKTSDPPIPTTIQDSPSAKPRVLAHRDHVEPDESMDVQHVEKRHSDILDYELKIANAHLDSAKSSPVDGNSMLRKPSTEKFLRASTKRTPLVRHKRKYRKFQPAHASIYSPPYSPVSCHRSSLRRSNSRRNLSALIRSSIVKITNIDGISSSEPKADLREEFLNALDAGEAARNSLQRSLGLGSNRPSLVLESPQEQQKPKSSWEATPSPSPPASAVSSSSPLSSLDLPSIYMRSESGSQPPTAVPAWNMRTANDDVPWRELCALAEFQGVQAPEGDKTDRGSGVSPQDEDAQTRRQERRLTFFEDEKVSDDASLHDDDVLADDEATPNETEMHLPSSQRSSPWVPLGVLADDSINHIDDHEPAQGEQQNTSTLRPPSDPRRLSAHRPKKGTRDQDGVATIYSPSRTKSEILSEYDAHSIHLPEYALDLMQELDRIRASFHLDPTPLTTPFETDEEGVNRSLSHTYHIHRHPFAAHPESESNRVLSIGAALDIERSGMNAVTASAVVATEPPHRSSDDSFATTKTTATATTFPRMSNETAATAYTPTPPRSPSSHYPKLDRIATTIAMRTTAATKTTNDKFFGKSSGHSRSQSLSGATGPYRLKTKPTAITIHDEDHQDQQGPTDFPTLYSLFSIPERLSASTPLPAGRLAVSEVPSSTAYRRRANSFFTPRCVSRGSAAAAAAGGMRGSLEKSSSSFEDHTIVPLGRQGSIKDRVMRQFSFRFTR
jgi:hypothetical protein